MISKFVTILIHYNHSIVQSNKQRVYDRSVFKRNKPVEKFSTVYCRTNNTKYNNRCRANKLLETECIFDFGITTVTYKIV